MKKFLTGMTIALTAMAFNTFSDVKNSNARVILKEKTKFYNVKGSTGAEIYRSMVTNGPDHGGNNKDVLASTSFSFDFKNDEFELRRNRCVLTNLDIVVNVTYTYPRWAGSRKASKATRKAWKDFEKTAIWHEKQHVKITQKFASDYEKVLKKSKRHARNECATRSVGEKVRTSFAIRKHERLHRRFDKRDLRKGGRGYKALLKLVRAK